MYRPGTLAVLELMCCCCLYTCALLCEDLCYPDEQISHRSGGLVVSICNCCGKKIFLDSQLLLVEVPQGSALNTCIFYLWTTCNLSSVVLKLGGCGFPILKRYVVLHVVVHGMLMNCHTSLQSIKQFWEKEHIEEVKSVLIKKSQWGHSSISSLLWLRNMQDVTFLFHALMNKRRVK